MVFPKSTPGVASLTILEQLRNVADPSAQTAQQATGCPEPSAGRSIKVVQLTSIHGPLDARIFHKHSKALANAGYQVVVIAPELSLTRDADEPRAGVTVKTVPRATSRRQRLGRTIWDVYRMAVAENADIYHFHDPELIPIGLLLKLHGKRVIYDVHENLPLQVLTKPWISPVYRK